MSGADTSSPKGEITLHRGRIGGAECSFHVSSASELASEILTGRQSTWAWRISDTEFEWDPCETVDVVFDGEEDPQECTLLYLCIILGHTRCAATLLENGADVNDVLNVLEKAVRQKSASTEELRTVRESISLTSKAYIAAPLTWFFGVGDSEAAAACVAAGVRAGSWTGTDSEEGAFDGVAGAVEARIAYSIVREALGGLDPSHPIKELIPESVVRLFTALPAQRDTSDFEGLRELEVIVDSLSWVDILMLKFMEDRDVKSADEAGRALKDTINWNAVLYNTAGTDAKCFATAVVNSTQFMLARQPKGSKELSHIIGNGKAKKFDSRIEKYCEVHLDTLPLAFQRVFTSHWLTSCPKGEEFDLESDNSLEYVARRAALLPPDTEEEASEDVAAGNVTQSEVDIDATFDLRSKQARGLNATSNDQKLTIYALYKQATEGPCDSSKKPSMFDVVATAKWNAWLKLAQMTMEEAKKEYISFVEGMLPEALRTPVYRNSVTVPREIDVGATFELRSNQAKSLNNLNNDQKLTIYGLFKQATEGECNESKKPSMFDLVATAKWNAWLKLGPMPMEEAKKEYISFVDGLLPDSLRAPVYASEVSSSPASIPATQVPVQSPENKFGKPLSEAFTAAHLQRSVHSTAFTYDQQCTLDALFQQVTIGPNDTKAPPFYKLDAKRKWKAWADLGGMGKEEAMVAFVELVESALP